LRDPNLPQSNFDMALDYLKWFLNVGRGLQGMFGSLGGIPVDLFTLVV